MTRLESIKFYTSIKTDADVKALFLGDLFFLMLVGLGRKDMNNDWCYARCREVEAAPDGYLDLWAREHYKSTIITVGKTIQDILASPDITVGIFSHSRGIAKSFLKQIKREFETNTLLRHLFPHICEPGRSEARTWSEDQGIIVKRQANPKEATVEAWGLVDGQPTGKHFSLLVYDDVVTLESVFTPEQIRKTTDAWRLSLNLGAHGGKIRMIGTRYHAADTYQTVLDQGSLTPRIYPATQDGTFDGESVFLSRESLANKRRDMGTFVFACQMMQNPLADKAQGFNTDWFRRLTGDANGKTMNRYLLVDPASSKKKSSDYTSMWVVGLNADGGYYVLDGVHDRLNLSERCKALFDLHRKHQPRAVGYERYGMQADIEHMRYYMEQVNYRFDILELGGAMPKQDRIKRLVPVFEEGRMWFPQRLLKVRQDGTMVDLTEEFYRMEFSTFPVSGHDDMLDCLARILDPDFGAIFPLAQHNGGFNAATFFE